MPTNVTPEYRAAEAKYKAASTSKEQLEALREMLSTIPKHKGTEKLQGDIKRRIAQTRREPAQKKSGKQKPFFHVDRADGGQTVLVGPPNSGKSLLLTRLTNAAPDVAEYPFTTHAPTPGMMPFKDTQLQLVDLPPVAVEGTEYWVFEIIKHADLVLFVLDACDDDVLAQADEVLSTLQGKSIDLAPVDADDPGLALPTIVVANKVDSPHAEDNLEIMLELWTHDFDILDVSAETGHNLEEFKRSIFAALKLMRVYTKSPGEPLERNRPFLLPIGSTVLDAANAVHHDFAEQLKFARIWGDRRFEGQMVGRDDELHDKDLVEFHI